MSILKRFLYEAQICYNVHTWANPCKHFDLQFYNVVPPF